MPLSGLEGTCDTMDENGEAKGDDEDCSGQNVCINSKCFNRSTPGEGCDDGDDGDCAEGLVCESSTCYEPWTDLGSPPERKHRAVAATIQNFIIIAGGTTASTYRFQPDAEPQWTTSPDLQDFPAGQRKDSAVAVVNNILYLMGGLDTNGIETNQVWSFDPSIDAESSDQWKRVQDMPGAIYVSCAASYNGLIYYFGGRDGNYDYQDLIYVFDPSADTDGEWTPLDLKLPRAISGCAAAQVREYIYITGGTAGGGIPFNTIYRFKPNGIGGAFENFPVDSTPVLSDPRYSHTATAVNDKIIIAGGINGELSTVHSVELFDPSTGIVSSLPETDSNQYYELAAAIGSTLFVFGSSYESFTLPV